MANIAISDSIKKQLIEKANAARALAYAPYSNFHVGAAILCEGGEIVTGANIENAAYGPSLCAERSAVAVAFSRGLRHFVALAVVSPSTPVAAPCGTCRQVLSEFAPDLPLILSNTSGDVEETTLGAIFLKQFDAAALRSGTQLLTE